MIMDKYVWHLVKNILTAPEYEAVVSRLRDRNYSHKDFNKAVKKLKAVGFDLEA